MTVRAGLGAPGAVVTAASHRRGLAVASAAGSATDPLVTRSGIVNAPGSPLRVSQNSPLGLSVLVQPGTAEIHRAGRGTYRPWNDAVATLTHDAVPPANSRWDLVYIAQRDAEVDADSLPVLAIAKGTALASPGKPYELIPAGGLVLAEVGPITSTTTQITDSMITNVAQYAAVRGAPIPTRTLAERDALTALASATFPITVERLDTGTLERNAGSGWRAIAIAMPAIQASSDVVTTDAAGLATVTYPQAFTTNVRTIQLTTEEFGSTGIAQTVGFNPANRTGFTARVLTRAGAALGGATVRLNWLAIAAP